MISVHEAFRLILENVPEPQTETVPLADATGRILLEDIQAERDMPPFDRVMMDGYALKWSEFLPECFKIEGIALAGHPTPSLNQTDACIEVTTGAPLPDGCDVIVPVEDCVSDNGCIRLREGFVPTPGRFIHRKGSDGLAGRTVLQPGKQLASPELAVLANEGVSEVSVGRLPRISLVTTGDEVVFGGRALEPHQIRGSHWEALRSIFQAYPSIDMNKVHAPDEENALFGSIAQSLQSTDILLITGGVSRGRKDLVPDLLQQIGVKEILHRVGQRPGKPLWFGRKGDQLVFGLPGNPVSALVCARRYVFPVMEKWMGATDVFPARIPVAGEVESLPDLVRYTPVQFVAGKYTVSPFHTSGSLHDLTGTVGFVEVPAGSTKADSYEFYPWTAR